MVPGTTLLTSRDIRSRLLRSNAKCLITDADTMEKLGEVYELFIVIQLLL
jgi:hypothetical protein